MKVTRRQLFQAVSVLGVGCGNSEDMHGINGSVGRLFGLSDIPGVVGYWNVVGSTLVKTGGGSPVDGNLVASISDLSGNGLTLSSPSGAEWTYRASEWNGGPCLRNISLDGHYLKPASRISNIRTVLVAIQDTGTNDYAPLSLGELSTGPNYQGGTLSRVIDNTFASANVRNGRIGINGLQLTSTVYGIQRPARPSILSFVTAGTTTGDCFFIDRPGNARGVVGRFRAMLVSTAALDTTTEIRAVRWLASQAAVSLKPRVIIHDGNSLTMALNVNGNQGYVWGAAADANNADQVYNWGIAGYQISDMQSRAATLIDPLITAAVASGADCWYCPFEIMNTLYYGNGSVTAAAAVTQYQTLCAGRRALGAKIMAMTPPPRQNAGTYAGYETDRLSARSIILGNTSWYDDCVDVGGLTNVGNNANYGSGGSTWVQTDRVHWTATGHAEVRAAYAARFNAH